LKGAEDFLLQFRDQLTENGRTCGRHIFHGWQRSPDQAERGGIFDGVETVPEGVVIGGLGAAPAVERRGGRWWEGGGNGRRGDVEHCGFQSRG
jgi:hypothetical protein